MKNQLLILPLVFMLCFTYGCQNSEEGISEDQAKVLLDNFMEIMNENNLALIEEIIDPECPSIGRS